MQMGGQAACWPYRCVTNLAEVHLRRNELKQPKEKLLSGPVSTRRNELKLPKEKLPSGQVYIRRNELSPLPS